MGMKRGKRKHIEEEIEDYHLTLKQIQIRREELLHPHQDMDTNIGGGRSNLPGDPTGQKGTALTEDVRLRNLEQVTNGIEQVWQDLTDEKKLFVKLFYWTRPKKYTLEGVAMKLSISYPTAKRWRNEIVQKVAKRIGW
jgi:RinA family phage transcriptional activator